MDDQPKKTEAEFIADLATRAAVQVGMPGEGAAPVMLAPDEHHLVSLEQYLQQPVRRRGEYEALSAESFVRLVQLLAGDKGLPSHIYSTGDSAAAALTVPKFTAVLNDHSADAAGWLDLRVCYACPLSVEWMTWNKANGADAAQPQVKFAKFIEDNLPDIVEPAGAQMLEVVRKLEATKSASFKSGVRLDNGDIQFRYEEDTQAKGPGDMVVPSEFYIAIPVLAGGPKHKVKARLRYRIDGHAGNTAGRLVFWYDLERPHKDLEHAIKGVTDDIATRLGVPVLAALPPQARQAL